uniref:Uncharacterized protein n=1 Tax=viral metagenome TaxID=1070528 RepID=A0A6C0M037_9ZZZZ
MDPSNPRVGVRWTRGEEAQLIASITAGKDIEDIAKEHGRKRGGITSRLRSIAGHMMEHGETVDDVCIALHMPREIVERVQQYSATTKNKHGVRPEKEALEVLKDIRTILVRIEARLSNDTPIHTAPNQIQ